MKAQKAVAREVRYQAFHEFMQPGDCLLTAHHQDDQAETLLIQLLRGAGPRGLAAMPCYSDFSEGWHARPLLNVISYYTFVIIEANSYTNKVIKIDLKNKEWRIKGKETNKLELGISDFSEYQLKSLIAVQDPKFYDSMIIMALI
ncbi:MAG: hypothetical protein GXP19_03800 [Gammaproteobacteria bacterium]|nr:hypothetical protein [Gammaproteobacteria bacterium]